MIINEEQWLQQKRWHRMFLYLFFPFVIFLASRAAEGLTNHVNGGSARPRPRTLLDGVVESGLAQLDGSQTEPEAQAEQPGHDRTHLLRTSKGAVNTVFSTFDLLTPKQTTHFLSHVVAHIQAYTDLFIFFKIFTSTSTVELI